ncbi:M23 family metallopeptidase [Lujinxingia vulgaris]|uniref:M23 family metallopeptidase n=1 Tax=Lujinxingia vulgaris TaxID=2600176 RepID=A0A5C6X1I7_9DELT|nr:M23 family metallopeptidase [Lujinxingia vulgaris]
MNVRRERYRDRPRSKARAPHKVRSAAEPSLYVRTRGLLPPDLDAYAIYGTPVLAPCEGEVLATRSDLPDQKPMEMDPDNLLGNFITLHCHDLTILLAHLRHDSPGVEAGDMVKAAQPIAEVGNTGNTSEPHLHIHAVEGRVTDHDTLAFEGKGMPMTFGSRFLKRNDRVQTR